MAQEIYIKVKVEDGQVDQTTKKLQKLGHEVENVEGGFNSAQESAGNLQGGVEGVATEFGNVAKAAKKGGAAMRSALISTGIGALIVALGIVIDNWEAIAKAVGLTNMSIEEQLELLNNKQKLLNEEVSTIDKQLKLAKLQGKSNEELQKQKVALLEQQKALNQSELRLLETQLLRLEAQKTELSTWETIKGVVSGILGGTDAVAKTASNIVIERQAEIDALKQKIAEAKGEAVDLEIALFGASSVEGGETIERGSQDFAGADRAGVQKIETALEINEQLINLDNDLTLNQAQNAQARELIARQEAEAKQQLLNATADGLMAFSKIAGQETSTGKVLAIAATLINTYSAIAGQLKAFAGVPVPGYAIAQAIATGAVGFAQVQGILKTKVPNGTGGGGGVGSPTSAGGQAAPSFNVVGTSGVNQIAETLGQDQQPVQAYVVGSNVTSQQALDRNIVETATIG